MNSFWVVIKIPGFWMKILEAIFTLLGLTFIFDSYIDIYNINYFNIVFSFLSTYLLISFILMGMYFRRRPEKSAMKLLVATGILWCILSIFCILLALYVGSKTVHLSKNSTLWLLSMVSSTGITFFIFSVITVYLIYCTYIEIHSIHTYHLLQCTAFTYFLICGTLITEYFSEETSHFTESMFLVVGILLHAVSATMNLYFYFMMRDSDLITIEFLLSGVFLIITGVLLIVDLLCIVYLDWPRDLRRERNPIRHGWWSGPNTRPKRDPKVSFSEVERTDADDVND